MKPPRIDLGLTDQERRDQAASRRDARCMVVILGLALAGGLIAQFFKGV